jgi:hypothetical protein
MCGIYWRISFSELELEWRSPCRWGRDFVGAQPPKGAPMADAFSRQLTAVSFLMGGVSGLWRQL